MAIAPVGEHPPISSLECKSLREQSQRLRIFSLPIKEDAHLVISQAYLTPQLLLKRLLLQMLVGQL